MFERLRQFALNYLVADVPLLSAGERWRSAVGALLGLSLTAALVALLPLNNIALALIAPMGASAVILFALPLSPLAQPWSAIGSYLVAALVALACAWLIPHEVLGAALAVALTIWLSARLYCLHPPSGAVAILIVFSHHQSPSQTPELIALALGNVVALVAAAVLVNRVILRRRYPHCRVELPKAVADSGPARVIGLSHADLSVAVKKMEGFLDIQENDLLKVYRYAIDHAFARHVDFRCADVMRRDVPVLEFASELQEAWDLLRDGQNGALPVLDRFNKRLLGVVTKEDFLNRIEGVTATSLSGQLRDLLRRNTEMVSEKPEVVGQIMSPSPFFVSAQTPAVELVRQLVGSGVHHVPVVDERQRYVGMVSQTDLIAALYQHIALERSCSEGAQSVASLEKSSSWEGVPCAWR